MKWFSATRLAAVLLLAGATAPAFAQSTAAERTALFYKIPVAVAAGGAAPVVNWATGTSNTAGGTSTTTSKGANTILSTDYLLVPGGEQDSDITYGDHTPTCPTGFTKLTLSSGSNPLWHNDAGWHHPIDIVMCGALASDVGTGGAYTINWTNAGDGYTFTTLIDIRGQHGGSGSAPIDDAASSTTNGYVQSFASPAVTASVSNDLRLSFYFLYNGDTTDPVTHPGTSIVQISGANSTYSSNTIPEIVVLADTPGSGVDGAKTLTTGPASSGIGTGGETWSVEIKGL